jgi:hypothetical protein
MVIEKGSVLTSLTLGLNLFLCKFRLSLNCLDFENEIIVFINDNQNEHDFDKDAIQNEKWKSNGEISE